MSAACVSALLWLAAPPPPPPTEPAAEAAPPSDESNIEGEIGEDIEGESGEDIEPSSEVPVDERYDPWRAADGAARHLMGSYKRLNVWPLAITAYLVEAYGWRGAYIGLGSMSMVVVFPLVLLLSSLFSELLFSVFTSAVVMP